MSERVMKIDRNDKSILIRALHAQYRERKAKGKSYTEIGQLILRIDATAPGRLCLGDDEYLLARNAVPSLRPYALNYHLYPAREVFPGIFI